MDKEDEEKPHPLGPETPPRYQTPDFAITGAVGWDTSVEDPESFVLRRDTPYVPEMIPPQQAFHSTELEPGKQDPRQAHGSHLQALPLTTEQAETITEKEHEPTDIFTQEKFTVPVDIQPSERWDIYIVNFPSQDPNAPIRIADRQEKRVNVVVINTGTVTVSIGPSTSALIPFLTVGASLKLETLAAIYANAGAGGQVTVIQELEE